MQKNSPLRKVATARFKQASYLGILYNKVAPRLSKLREHYRRQLELFELPYFQGLPGNYSILLNEILVVLAINSHYDFVDRF
jgi:hypothetical protein